MNIAEKDQLERLKEQLKAQIDKVPHRVSNGSIQDTRDWLQVRDEAKKMLGKSNINAGQILSMIDRLK